VEAGARMVRQSGGNNITKYNWRGKLSSHPDWDNNVYSNNRDAVAKYLTDWPADSTMAILDHWFGTNGLGNDAAFEAGLTEYPPGLYWITVRSDHSTETRKSIQTMCFFGGWMDFIETG
jgi:hypothetical protein